MPDPETPSDPLPDDDGDEFEEEDLDDVPISSPSDAAPPAEAGKPPEEDWATRYRYLLAEFDNYRKRVEREREQVRREHRAGVLRELLPLTDAFGHAQDAAKRRPSEDPLRRGLELLVREWERFLSTQQVSPVARPGETFRPEEEEAVAEMPADRDHPDGTVVEVVQQGYRSAGGLLRAAKVIVARAHEAAVAAPASSGPTTGNGT